MKVNEERIKNPHVEELTIPFNGKPSRPGYMLRWSLHENELSMSFEVVKVTGYEDAGDRSPVFISKHSGGLTHDVHTADAIVEGFVKWDGCTNFWFPEMAGGWMMHACTREDLLDIGLVLALVRDFAASVIDQWCDG